MTGAIDGDDLRSEAGEYVLGTLDAAEREAFSLRLRDDEDARQAVAGWDRRLAALGLCGESVMPPRDLWARIEQSLRTTGGKPLPFRVIQGGNRPNRSAEPAPDYRRSRDRWRASAIAGGAVAAALLTFIAVRETGIWPAEEAPNIYLAAVNRGGDKPALIVRVDLKTRQVLVHPVATETPAGRSLELWYVGDGKPPQSMGLIKAAPAVLPMPRGAAPGGTMTIAVSVEPEGGSKTGSPTGPVVYSGQLIAE